MLKESLNIVGCESCCDVLYIPSSLDGDSGCEKAAKHSTNIVFLEDGLLICYVFLNL